MESVEIRSRTEGERVVITTTLKRIKKHRPRQNVWKKLLKGLGKTEPDDEPLPFSKILEINGLDDALWCCRVEPRYAREWRLFEVTCARRVQHLNPDPRVKNAIDVAERYANGEATDEELRVALGATRDVERDAVSDIARDVAWAVFCGVAGETVNDVALDTAICAARYAVRTDARVTWDAAGLAEREWQTQEFLRIVTETEERVA